jgi:CPA1 family monovalent cation:H+ antiporter
MVSLFDIFAALLLLIAAFGWMNLRFFRLPSNVGLLLIGVVVSALLLSANIFFPGLAPSEEIVGALRKIDFGGVVMNGMLGFLLFAGAIHVDWKRLKRRFGSVATLATIGVLISTFTVGIGFWVLAQAFGFAIPVAWALVFGALISPTDPVAVLAMLKSARAPQLLETEMAGESLFNDGVGVVLFTILLAVAAGGGGGISVLSGAGLFIMEAVGGGAIGLATGTLAFYAMRSG